MRVLLGICGALSLGVALFACSPRVCVVGTTTACTGPGGCAGTQPCNPDGIGYGTCTCGTGEADAGRYKPDVMILLDKSGSMAAPIDPSSASCPASSCPGASCPSGCATRISELRSGLSAFLSTSGTRARFGLTTYPTSATCGSADVVRLEISTSNDVDGELQARADEIRTAVQAIGITGSSTPGSLNEVGGGTPTTPSLNFLASYPLLKVSNRDDYILLITDGLPNCNSANTNNCLNAATCRCTTTNCGTDTSAPFCTLGCLDQQGAVTAVTALRNAGIRTIVVGFGADTTTGDGPAVLNAMAEAGGMGMACLNGTAAECGSGNTCDTATKACARRYYSARNAAELSATLADIANRL